MNKVYIVIYCSKLYIKFLKIEDNYFTKKITLNKSGIIGIDDTLKDEAITKVLENLHYKKSDNIITNEEFLKKNYSNVNLINNSHIKSEKNSLLLELNEELVVKKIVNEEENEVSYENIGMKKVFENLTDLTCNFNTSYKIIRSINLLSEYNEKKLSTLQSIIKENVDNIILQINNDLKDSDIQSIDISGIGALIIGVSDYIRQSVGISVNIVYSKLETNKVYTISERQALIEADEAVEIFNNYYINNKHYTLKDLAMLIKQKTFKPKQTVLIENTKDLENNNKIKVENTNAKIKTKEVTEEITTEIVEEVINPINENILLDNLVGMKIDTSNEQLEFIIDEGKEENTTEIKNSNEGYKDVLHKLSEEQKSQKNKKQIVSKVVYKSIKPEYFKIFSTKTKIKFLNGFTLIGLGVSKVTDSIAKNVKIYNTMRKVDKERKKNKW